MCHIAVTNVWRQEQLYVTVPKYALVFTADRAPDRTGNIIVDDVSVTSGACSGETPIPPDGSDGNRQSSSSIRFYGNKNNDQFLKARNIGILPCFVDLDMHFVCFQ